MVRTCRLLEDSQEESGRPGFGKTGQVLATELLSVRRHGRWGQGPDGSFLDSHFPHCLARERRKYCSGWGVLIKPMVRPPLCRHLSPQGAEDAVDSLGLGKAAEATDVSGGRLLVG